MTFLVEYKVLGFATTPKFFKQVGGVILSGVAKQRCAAAQKSRQD